MRHWIKNKLMAFALLATSVIRHARHGWMRWWVRIIQLRNDSAATTSSGNLWTTPWCGLRMDPGLLGL